MPIQHKLDGQAIDLLALHSNDPQRYPVLLESVTHGQKQGRYDILFAQPQETLSYHHQTAPESTPDFLSALDRQWHDCRKRCPTTSQLSDLPFDGGWFLFLGYELAAGIEPTLRLPADDSDLPTAFAMRCPAAVIVDHQQGQNWFVVADDHATRQNSWLKQLESDCDCLAPEVCPSADNSPGTSTDSLSAVQPEEEDPEQFLNSLNRIKHYITEGDVFQVNIARRWTVDAALDPVSIYRHLRSRNPAPFAGLARWQGNTILSSSPERLVTVLQNEVSTRPIAGTHPRARSGDDQTMTESLRRHPKERAEHIMLIDLERNDLGRVCRPGTIDVDELMVIESYAHVHHIVSNIRGELRSGITPGEVIRAVFPGGTITGCPKVRCMEIIAELEQGGRGAYTGSMGYLNINGDLDLNILIRTIQMNAYRATFMAGCGVVADSDPQRELDETRSKARGMLLALSGKQHQYPDASISPTAARESTHG